MYAIKSIENDTKLREEAVRAVREQRARKGDQNHHAAFGKKSTKSEPFLEGGSRSDFYSRDLGTGYRLKLETAWVKY